VELTYSAPPPDVRNGSALPQATAQDSGCAFFLDSRKEELQNKWNSTRRLRRPM